MKTLIILGIILALLVFYIVVGRNWLRSIPALKPFFDFIEPAEIFLWKKSETILWARLKMFVGVLLTFLTQIGTIDLTPIMPFVPDKYEGMVKAAFNLMPLIITVMGMLDEKLRNATSKPLELVAVSDQNVPPAVAQAVAKAEVAKEIAVAEVEAAKV